MFSDWILLSKLMDCTWRNVTPALCMKFWQLHIWERSYLDEPPCAVESDEKHKMMHVLDWKACSNDSVVDVTPGVEQWHTLWFMWESPRCPEHLIFTTKTMTIVHCFIKRWHHIWITLLNVFYTFFRLTMMLFRYVPLLNVTHYNCFLSTFWTHVKWILQSSLLCVKCARLPPSQYSRLSDGHPGSRFGTFVYLVSHCVWDLLSTCETRSVPVRGEAASWNRADTSPELCEKNFTLPHLYNKCTPLPDRNN